MACTNFPLKKPKEMMKIPDVFLCFCMSAYTGEAAVEAVAALSFNSDLIPPGEVRSIATLVDSRLLS
jgi:hypothetical protein